jgi:hypothetical protein
MPPAQLMLAKAVTGVPEQESVAGGLLYEHKWDDLARCCWSNRSRTVMLPRALLP